MKKKIKSIGEDYSKFLMIYESVSYARKGFFGLRDFYSMVTEVCQSSIQKGHDADFLEEYYKAICRNFDGQEKSLKLFRSVIPDMNN
jgi:hypothetical protein